MGKVFLASSPDGAEVALKTVVFPEGLNARARWETVERFQREARAARSLDHPNICQVLDIGAEADTFFIVMEYLKGRSLREEIDSSGAIPLERSAAIMFQVCDALAYAHDKGIVHRDIKPDNIMALQSGQAKLMDFGLAAIVYESGVTQTGTMMGTFAYMSPEQARGEKLDARSDIFSLGATFYEMLTGQQPFQGEAPGAVLNEILTKEVEHVSGLPPAVSRALNKCLRKQPSYRFQNVGEIASALRTAGFTPAEREAPTAQGTMVLPGQASQTAASPSERSAPASSAPAAGQTAPDTPSPGQRAQRTGRTTPDLRCPKCGEGMAASTPSCWRCGTPNPSLARRKTFHESQVAINEALKDFKPRKKRGWLRRR
jgi:serine/threonine-protein kinase